MSKVNELVNIMDGNFSSFGENIYSPHMGYSRFACRYTEFIDSFTIVARGFSSDSIKGSVVTGEKCEFVNLGESRGGKKFLRNLRPMIKVLMNQIKSDSVILIRFPGNIAIISIILCFIYRRKFHVEIVADPAQYFSRQVSSSKFRVLFKAVHVFFTKFAARYGQTVRYVTAEYLQEKYPAKGPSFGFSDVYIDDKCFNRYQGNANPELQLVTVGMMHNHSKGTKDLIKAVELINANGVDCSLQIIGGGKLKQEYEEYASALNIEDRIEFLGTLGFDDICRKLETSDLFVLASYQEGMPRALLEAMSIGLPVISSNCGGIPEVVPSRHLFKPGDIDMLVELILNAYKTQIFPKMSKENLDNVNAFLNSNLKKKYKEYIGFIMIPSKTSGHSVSE